MAGIPFEVLLDRGPYAVLVVDSTGRIRYANNSALDILEYDRQELMGQPVELLLPERFRSGHVAFRSEYMEEPIPRRMGAGRDLQARTRSGREIPVEIGLSPLGSGEDRYVAVHLVDITQRLMQQEIHSRQTRLESVGFLAGGMAHDFNNVLGAISGNLDLMALAPLPEGVEKSLERIRSLVRRGSGLARRLISFSKGGSPVFHRTDLHRVIREASEEVTVRAGDLEFDLPADLWPAYVDETLIGQVLANLVINAVQAAPAGRITIAARNVEITASESGSVLRPGSYVRIDVSDTGPGIPEEIRTKVFDPFFTTKAGGTGLGLAMCHTIVERHAGLITVRSAPGQGATFEVFLPAHDPAEGPAQGVPVPGEPHECADTGRVLVLDDDEQVRLPLVEYLAGAGYEVAAASTGQEALALLKASLVAGTPFRAAVLDIVIPGQMGGVEAAKVARGWDPHLALVLMSGYSHEAVGPLLADSAVDDYLTKPFRSQELVKILQRLLCQPT